MDNQIHLVANRWECPDGTILQSHHRHDYAYHVDEHGTLFFCDGGPLGYYIRTSGNLIDRCVRSTDPFELQREFFMWGSYGKDGKQDKNYIALKDLTDQHISAILETQHHIRGTYVEVLMIAELEYRKEHGLTVEEKE